MVKEVKQSLIVRSGMELAAVLFLAVLTMLVSYLTAENSENDAVRINLAGSLRMQSYRIATQVVLLHGQRVAVRDPTALIKEVDEFERRFHQPVLSNHLQNSRHLLLNKAFFDVERQWQALRIKLLDDNYTQTQLLADIDSLVDTIDEMVKSLERLTESKFSLLRLIQGVSLLAAACIVSLAFYNIYYRVVSPLQRMVAMATRVREGDFSARMESMGDDELSLLAETFNEMVESLDTMYHNLEDKVAQKTLHLERVQKGLRLLYEESRRLSSDSNLVEQLAKTIGNLQQYLQIEQVDLYMAHETNEHPFLVSSSETPHVLIENVDELLAENGSWHQMKYALARGEENYGYLVIRDHSPLVIDTEIKAVLTALVDTIVSALTNEASHDQQHRLALMEERAAIARELHDSLAQSLSYTKIQVSRFQLLQKNNADTEELDGALSEIRTGIQSAYGQLREILATFRLQLNSPGLYSSLEMTVVEFSEKGSVSIDLDYELENFPLTPNEEIHVLQIVREALSNILRHSQASSAEVSLKLNNQGQVIVSITDNGKGFANAEKGPNHYGRTIMEERASILGGHVSFEDQAAGGAAVVLVFESNRVTDQQELEG